MLPGIIFNDYFDIETDMREGRLRPLSSGSVRKRAAVLLAFIFLALALVISAFVGVLICGFVHNHNHRTTLRLQVKAN